MLLPHYLRNFYRKFFEYRNFLSVFAFGIFVVLAFVDISGVENFQRAGLDKSGGEMYQIIKAASNSNNQKAKNLLEKLLQKDPENVWAIRLYGKYLDEELGEVGAEIEKTKRIVEVNPEYKAAWLRLSLLYKKSGMSDLAEEANKKAGADSF